MNRNMNFRYKSIVPISKKEYDKKDTLPSYKSLLTGSFINGVGTGAGYQIVTRTIDNILGPQTINIKNEGEYGNSIVIRTTDNTNTSGSNTINIKNEGEYGNSIVIRTIDNTSGPNTINIKNEGEYGNATVIRPIDNILGSHIINIKNGSIYGGGGGCINELMQFIDCVKANGYYQCNKSFNEFEKCYSK